MEPNKLPDKELETIQRRFWLEGIRLSNVDRERFLARIAYLEDKLQRAEATSEARRVVLARAEFPIDYGSVEGRYCPDCNSWERTGHDISCPWLSALSDDVAEHTYNPSPEGD